jgi:N-acetyltransferase
VSPPWIDPPPLFSGRLVRLEPLTRAHEPALAQAAAEPSVWRWMHVDGSQPELLRRWLDATYEAAGRGDEVPFATLDARSGEALGSTRYMALAPEHRRLEIGSTWLASRAWNTGANLEAKLLMLEHAFEILGCLRVELKTDASNERSRGAMEALPAQFEGIHRKAMLVRGGQRRDSAWYSVIVDEWPEVRAHLERRLAGRS